MKRIGQSGFMSADVLHDLLIVCRDILLTRRDMMAKHSIELDPIPGYVVWRGMNMTI